MSRPIRRRDFLRQVALAVPTAAATGRLANPGRSMGAPVSPNERLNLGIIGTINRAGANLAGVAGENIVALCDVNEDYLSETQQKFPKARTYNDFRRLLDQPDLDAVVVSATDHTHAAATVMALKRGKHVYCEKPLTHTVSEARIVAETAARAGVATQMGTQIHAGNNYRRVVELVQAGILGPIREVHVWCNSARPGEGRPSETPPVPPGLHWDLWLGPAPDRPYHPTYLPKEWRRWWDFGNGVLGDMACHYIDLPQWALKLRHPSTVEAEGPPPDREITPDWLIVRYVYPARGDLPPVALTWYDSGKRPPLLSEAKLPAWKSGVLFVGAKGMLIADYNRHRLWPEDRFKDLEPPPPTIPGSIGHHQEWIAACKTGSPTTCNFDYSGALTETVLLGSVAYRVGKKLDWDPEGLKARNCPEADEFVQHRYRRGWTL